MSSTANGDVWWHNVTDPIWVMSVKFHSKIFNNNSILENHTFGICEKILLKISEILFDTFWWNNYHIIK